MDKFYIIVDRDKGAFIVCLTLSNLVENYRIWNKTDHTHVYMVDLRATRMSVEEILPRELY